MRKAQVTGFKVQQKKKQKKLFVAWAVRPVTWILITKKAEGCSAFFVIRIFFYALGEYVWVGVL
jgi:hypothetical protein